MKEVGQWLSLSQPSQPSTRLEMFRNIFIMPFCLQEQMERLERLSPTVLDTPPQLEISIPGAEPVQRTCVCTLCVCWHSISLPEGKLGA